MTGQQFSAFLMGFETPDKTSIAVLGDSKNLENGDLHIALISRDGSHTLHDAELVERGARSGKTIIEIDEIGTIVGAKVDATLSMPNGTVSRLSYKNNLEIFPTAQGLEINGLTATPEKVAAKSDTTFTLG